MSKFQPLTELRNEFKQKLKLAHDALDTFAESRLNDADTFTEMKSCRAAVEAFLRFGRTGNSSDPCIDHSKVPTVEIVTPLSMDSKVGRSYWERMAEWERRETNQ